MKDDNHYLGSVRFYKHLIIVTTISVFLAPTVGLFFAVGQYWKLKQNYDSILNENQLYISQLEAKLALQQEENTDTGICLETDQVNDVQRSQKLENIADENNLLIPFSVDLEEVEYILVNDRHPLPQSFQPELVETRNGQSVHKEIKASLEKMIDDAKEEGFDVIICSAYRDYKEQAELVQNSIDEKMQQGYNYTEAYWMASEYLTMVGRSEHHTGLAVDLVGVSYQLLDEDHAYTPEGRWLIEHAHEYGFVLRYPTDKEEITGVQYESWHYRYVGKQAASFMKEQNLCLEEFLDLACKQKDEKAAMFVLDQP